MAKISFTNMKLKLDNEKKICDFKGNNIEVLQYLPFEDKYSLVMITLQNAWENGYYNPIKLDMYFYLYLVYMYTNINFTDKQREDETKLYDVIKESGLLQAILKEIPENEYKELLNWMEETKEESTKAKNSIVPSLNQLIQDLPKQADAMQNIVDNFDKNKFKEVIDFAKAANGGRDSEFKQDENN